MKAEGARVEIVERDVEPGGCLVPSAVRVNGMDVGAMSKPPKVVVRDGDAVTVTLVLIPASVEIKGDDVREEKKTIGFAAG